MLDVLGEEFNGVLGCDYFSAYRKYAKDCGVQVQFCLAHLIRDVKYLATPTSRFITTPGVDPTNNVAEQAIRFIVIDRRVTQGTRGAVGRGWSERIWTVVATCAMQHRSVFDYLHRVLRAHFTGRPVPSLLPLS